MATTTTNATTFDALDAWMGSKHDRPYAHNTRARRLPDHPQHGAAIGIRLHGTDVVTFYADGFVRVTTGGWETVTTWDRIRTALPHVRIADGRYLYRCEGSYIHPTNDAERAQALDGYACVPNAWGRERAVLDVTFNPSDLPTITAVGRSLTMRACGEGRHQGEARVGGWGDGTVLHYAAVKVRGGWRLARTTATDGGWADVSALARTLRDAKRLAWEDAHRLGFDA